MPTLCAVAGVDAPTDRAMDGTDVTPLFRGEEIVRTRPLFWYFYRNSPQMALRSGDWVLNGFIDDPVGKRSHWLSAADMPFIKESTPTRFELFNVRTDIGQQKNLAESEPARLAELKAQMVALHRDVVEEGDDWTEAIAGYTRP